MTLFGIHDTRWTLLCKYEPVDVSQLLFYITNLHINFSKFSSFHGICFLVLFHIWLKASSHPISMGPLQRVSPPVHVVAAFSSLPAYAGPRPISKCLPPNRKSFLFRLYGCPPSLYTYLNSTHRVAQIHRRPTNHYSTPHLNSNSNSSDWWRSCDLLSNSVNHLVWRCDHYSSAYCCGFRSFRYHLILHS